MFYTWGIYNIVNQIWLNLKRFLKYDKKKYICISPLNIKYLYWGEIMLTYDPMHLVEFLLVSSFFVCLYMYVYM